MARPPRLVKRELLTFLCQVADTLPTLRKLASHVNGLPGRTRLQLRRLADATEALDARLTPAERTRNRR